MTVAYTLSAVWFIGACGEWTIPVIESARRDRAFLDMERLSDEVRSYRVRTGSLPTNEQGLRALGRPLVEAAVDPWGNPYLYSRQGCGFFLLSTGKDGRVGGRGDAHDISTADPDSLDAGRREKEEAIAEHFAWRVATTWAIALPVWWTLRRGRLHQSLDWRERWQPFAFALLLLIAAAVAVTGIVLEVVR